MAQQQDMQPELYRSTQRRTIRYICIGILVVAAAVTTYYYWPELAEFAKKLGFTHNNGL